MSFYSNSTLSSIDLVETFELYDKNKDGFIDENDLSIVLNDLGQDSDPIRVKKMMEVADLDKDGQINLNEFIIHMQSTLFMEYEEEQENMVDLFRIFKQNENGHINIEDLRVCVHQMGENLSEDEFNDLVKEFDSDCDGFISFEEFCRMMN